MWRGVETRLWERSRVWREVRNSRPATGVSLLWERERWVRGWEGVRPRRGRFRELWERSRVRRLGGKGVKEEAWEAEEADTVRRRL